MSSAATSVARQPPPRTRHEARSFLRTSRLRGPGSLGGAARAHDRHRASGPNRAGEKGRGSQGGHREVVRPGAESLQWERSREPASGWDARGRRRDPPTSRWRGESRGARLTWRGGREVLVSARRRAHERWARAAALYDRPGGSGAPQGLGIQRRGEDPRRRRRRLQRGENPGEDRPWRRRQLRVA